ncbi:hypothetical protein ISO16_11255 [Rhodococcus sp. M8]|nr:hypothetical protein ISO16_11255 [Rhodococcus sp. M8]
MHVPSPFGARPSPPGPQDNGAGRRVRHPVRGYGTLSGMTSVGSPVWNSSAPMIMWAFAEGFDFAGTRVHPITTHAVSGLGNIPDDYEQACRGATLGESLAVRGEEVRDAGGAVDSWLQRTGLL